jgi:nitrogenase molybdenum-iron protein alpha chain
MNQKIATREQRLNALSAYYGLPEALVGGFYQAKQMIRTFSQSNFDEILHTLYLLHSISGAGVVVHGARGCASAEMYFNAVENENNWVSTDLDEKDSILGGEAKLRKAIEKISKHNPSVVFVVTTPIVSINADDISVTEELSEELGIPVIPIYCDGFNSRVGINGYDVASHSLAKNLFAPVASSENRINIISVSEEAKDIQELNRLLSMSGLEANVFPRFTSISNFKLAAGAKASISVNPDFSDYLGKYLEENYNIPFLQPSMPVGIKSTNEWLLTLGEKFRLIDKIENLIQNESKKFEVYKYEIVKGKRIYVSSSTSISIGIARFLKEMGAELAGMTITHLDAVNLSHLRKLEGDFQLHIAQGQAFEQVNILKRVKPDLYIGGAGQAALAAKLGIPAISTYRLGIIGYSGAKRLAERIKNALLNPNFIHKLSSPSIYKDQWYQKSPNWHIKQEVR